MTPPLDLAGLKALYEKAANASLYCEVDALNARNSWPHLNAFHSACFNAFPAIAARMAALERVAEAASLVWSGACRSGDDDSAMLDAINLKLGPALSALTALEKGEGG